MNKSRSLFIPVVGFIIVLVFYFFDIGNPSGLRQGTEGFYLKIAKEMSENLDLLNPTYLGNPHWSKPPLVFWIAQPLGFLFPNDFLFSSRFSIALCSLFLLVLIALCSHTPDEEKKWRTKFFFLASSLGVLKYSRIFMMETPLALLTTLSVLLFYHSYSRSSRGYLLGASLVFCFSLLVKGPVAGVMVFPAILAFSMGAEKRKESFKRGFLFLALGTILASLWFLVMSLEHGKEFLEYFFLRENFGKFESKSYPISSLFNGLVLYGLPWSLFLPSAVIYFWRNFQGRSVKLKELDIILIYFFIFSFSIWMIPNQKSHHYSFTSVIAMIILISRHFPAIKAEARLASLSASLMLRLIYAIIFIAACLTLSFSEFRSFPVYFYLFVLISLFLFNLKVKEYTGKFGELKILNFLIVIGFIWSVLIPTFALPFIPSEKAKLLRQRNITVVVRKPFFVEEVLEKKVRVSSPGDIAHDIVHSNPENDYFLVHKHTYQRQNLANVADIVDSWPIWLRGRKLNHIWDAAKEGSMSSLFDQLIVLKKKP